MALPYSTRFIGNVLNPPQTLVYTVPVGKRAVVRSISITAQGTGALTGGVTVKTLTFIFQSEPIPVYSSATWEGRQVVNSGEQIECTATGGLFFMVSGYLLDDTP